MATDQDKSKEELLQELAALRVEVAALKAVNGPILKPVSTLSPEAGVAQKSGSPVTSVDSLAFSETEERPLILIVEDDPIMHGLLELLLGRKYRVASAFEGGEGLEKALKLSPDLIMIDVMMQGMSGDQLVVELRRRPVFDDVPLVILTARADDQLRLSMLSSNIQAYLNKPFENEEVQIWVDNLINRRLQLVEERRSQREQLRSHQELRVVNEQLLQALEIRRQAEIQLRANQELLDSVLNSSPDAIVALDPIRDETGQIVDFEWILANTRAAALNQLSIEVLKGSRLLTVMPGIISSGLFTHYVQVAESGIPFRAEVFYDYDHIRGWFDLTVVKRGPGIAVTGRDITQQKGDQEAIRHLNHILARRAAELERANEELKEFSYSISHDLRAPLRAISGFAQIIQRRHAHHLNKEGQHYLDNILMASNQMGRLIDDLLIYTRLGREPVQIEPVALGEIVANIKEHYHRQLERLEATLELPPVIPLIRGDAVLLSRLFTNLIDNALKYHRPEVPPQVKVGYQVEDSSLVVYVQDNGLGIAAEYHQQIFNLFQRLHSLEDYPGTGLGLAIVKRSAQLMNGNVWLDSAPGEGSTFYIRLLLA